MPDQGIIDRIKAALRKADPKLNPNEHERAVAMGIARKLMMKYDIEISMEDLDDNTMHGFENTMLFAKPRSEHWQGLLITNIAEFYHCRVWIERDNQPDETWRCLGRKHHVEALRVIFDFLVPQLEREFMGEMGQISKQGQFARLYGEKALIENIWKVEGEIAAREVKADLEEREVSDDRIADAGWARFLLLPEDEDPVEDIMNLCRISSYNYAKKVRPYIKKKEIAKVSLENHQAAAYKWSFYKGAIIAVCTRLSELQKENIEEFGQKGQELITNEDAELERALQREGLDLEERKGQGRWAEDAAQAGFAAGQRADLATGSKVGMPQWKELGA